MIASITAIEAASWHTPLVLRGHFSQTIETAARLGYAGIELHLKDASALDQPALARALKQHGIRLTSIGTGPSYSQDGIFLTHDDPQVRSAAMARMASHIRLAAAHGAVVIIGLIKGQRRDVSDPGAYDGRLDEAMRTLIPMAEGAGVKLVFEVIDRFESDWLNTVNEGLAFLDRYGSPALALHLDTFHMNIEEASLEGAIHAAAGRIGHVHVADSDRWYPSHAHYDFAGTFRALHQVGYDGAVALESFLYPDPETAARKSLACLRDMMETAP
ncbi:MAG: sugar phosphate isomerase/epimerase [Clostridia bacterium]|nr:sugar phosphate isomerase/epimerase [Clostridia bacterium]